VIHCIKAFAKINHKTSCIIIMLLLLYFVIILLLCMMLVTALCSKESGKYQRISHFMESDRPVYVGFSNSSVVAVPNLYYENHSYTINKLKSNNSVIFFVRY